jgi:hypothetical protein
MHTVEEHVLRTLDPRMTTGLLPASARYKRGQNMQKP